MRVTLKPDLDAVRELLNYDKETGVFTWKQDAGRWGRIKAGSVAGTPNGEGYRYIWVGKKCLPAARLAWLLTYGEWPDRIVDHKNGNKDDNRLDNLRLADDLQSNANRKVHKRNLCGLKGVSKKGKDWRARITVGRDTVHLGYFKSKEEAHAAYLAKSKELHGEFAHA